MAKITQMAEQLYCKVLPPANQSAHFHLKAKQRFEEYMRSQVGGFMVEVDPGPVGDKEIILRTAVLAEQQIAKKTNPDHYFGSGYSEMYTWLKRLERHGFNLRTARAIMEFGCGSARLIRHLRCIDELRLVGTDVMPAFIEWCQTHVPGIEFYVNELTPPLPIHEDDLFDLVFAQSVFTHIPLDTQELWLQELHRVIRPGGFLLCTVLGRYHQQQMLSPAEIKLLKENHHYILDAYSTNASVSTQLIGSWDTFQTRYEVLKVFGSHFAVRDYIAGPLDLLVLQKPATV